MDMIRLSMLAVFAALFSCFLKSYRQDWAVLFSVCVGFFLALSFFNKLSEVFSFFYSLENEVGGMREYIAKLGKALGIAYICEFAVSICKESGNLLIADQIALCGKLAIFLLGLPILMTLLSVITEYAL